MNLEELIKVLKKKENLISKIEKKGETYTFSLENLFFKINSFRVASSNVYHALTISEDSTFPEQNQLFYTSLNLAKNPDVKFCVDIFNLIRDLHRDRILDSLNNE